MSNFIKIKPNQMNYRSSVIMADHRGWVRVYKNSAGIIVTECMVAAKGLDKTLSNNNLNLFGGPETEGVDDIKKRIPESAWDLFEILVCDKSAPSKVITRKAAEKETVDDSNFGANAFGSAFDAVDVKPAPKKKPGPKPKAKKPGPKPKQKSE